MTLKKVHLASTASQRTQEGLKKNCWNKQENREENFEHFLNFPL